MVPIPNNFEQLVGKCLGLLCLFFYLFGQNKENHYNIAQKGRAGAPRLVVDHIHKCWCVISFLQKLSNVVKSMKMQLQFLLPTNILDDRKGGCHEVNTTFKVVRHNRKNFQTCQNHQIEMWYDH